MKPLPPIAEETPEDRAAVDSLVEAAFGPGRYAKAAERLREGNRPLLGISVVAYEAGALVGCARMWPVRIGATPAVLLGPFAVADSWRNKGLGLALILDACARARAAGHKLVILVGDRPYFARAGFSPVNPLAIVFPGPVDMNRVLALALTPGADEGLQGVVRAP